MLTFEPSDSYPIAILIKTTSFQRGPIYATYVKPLEDIGISKGDIIALPLEYNANKKAPVKLIKSCLDDLLATLLDLGVKTIYCADAAYFKTLIKQHKAEQHLGYVLPAKYEGFTGFDVILGVNHTSLIYSPTNDAKLNLSMKALVQHLLKEPDVFANSLLKDARSPVTLAEIKHQLGELHSHPALTCDVETFSLSHDKAGIGSIAFAWNTTDGVAFLCDYKIVIGEDPIQGSYTPNPDVRELLREFFNTYQGKLTFHNAAFDIKMLVYTLFMSALDDNKGLVDGLECITRHFDDTKIIAYLALNSTAGNELGLKVLAQEYCGNYAQEDVNDIRRIYHTQLLEYNLIDCCATQYVYEKYWPKMLEDEQERIYREAMIPSIKTIVQMELVGMPLNPERVQEARHELEIIRTFNDVKCRKHPVINSLQELLTVRAHKQDYEMRVAKAKKPENIKEKDFEKFPTVRFNANSPKHLQVLFYEILQLPVIERTKTKQPSTGADVIKKLSNHVKDESVKELFVALIAFSQAEKILSTFISAFEEAISHSPNDPRVYIHGSFNLGGTVSSRLSSSNPNLQNIPSNSIFGKLIKSCFSPKASELFVGADFNALEAMVNALTTKDPNKLTVYENDLDSHSWYTFNYWPDKMPDIQAKMDKAELDGKFYKQLQPDGSYQYFHESEL